MIIKDFLKDFAEKFSKNEIERQVILKSSVFSINNTFGIFSIYTDEIAHECELLCRLNDSYFTKRVKPEKFKEIIDILKDSGIDRQNHLFYERFSDSYETSIFECADLKYLWDNLISKCTKFIVWMEQHNLTKEDISNLKCKVIGDSLKINAEFKFWESRSNIVSDSLMKTTLEEIEEESKSKEKNTENVDFYYSQIDGVGKVFFDNITNSVTMMNN